MLFVNGEIQIPDEELEFTYVRSGGPGGQAVNKVSSKAQLRWNFAQSGLPYGVRERFLTRYGGRLTVSGELILASDRHRDRLQNRQDCLDKLRELLLSVALPPKPRKKTKPGRGARERAKASKQRQGAKKRSRSGRDWD
jgi:ribosome-associated protein